MVGWRRGRWFVVGGALLGGLALLASQMGATPSPAGPSGSPGDPSTPPSGSADAVISGIVRTAMTDGSLRAVVVKVTRGDRVVAARAFGESLTGEPATTGMRFRNGAVAFAYIGTLLMRDVDAHKVTLDDTIGRWEPQLPEANRVTLRMLANQTTGYPDFEKNPKWQLAYYADPFHGWTYQQRLAYAFSRPTLFAPGTNWSYAHTNFMILGDILAKVGGRPLDELLREEVLAPMGLKSTVASNTGSVPEPALHAYSSERRVPLGIPKGDPFYEESTYWNADWGTPIGANETSTIDDMATTAEAVGTGRLLTPASYHAMTDSKLIGFGHEQTDCVPECFTQTDAYNYGLGVVRSGDWILQPPLLGGYSAVEAYLPKDNVGVSVVATYLPGAFDCEGGYPNAGDSVFRAIGAYMAPDDPPPAVPPHPKSC